MFEATDDSIRMMGVFGIDWTADEFVETLNEFDGRDVTINIHSPGGDVLTGLSMANSLRDYPGKVTARIDAISASISTVFMMEADEIVAHDNSVVMIHQAMTAAAGNERELREAAEVLDVLDSTIAKVYARRTGRGESYWLEKMRNETYFQADQAKKVGLVDSLVGQEVARPAASEQPILTLEKISVSELKSVAESLLGGEQKPPRPRLARASALLESIRLRTK